MDEFGQIVDENAWFVHLERAFLSKWMDEMYEFELSESTCLEIYCNY